MDTRNNLCNPLHMVFGGQICLSKQYVRYRVWYQEIFSRNRKPFTLLFPHLVCDYKKNKLNLSLFGDCDSWLPLEKKVGIKRSTIYGLVSGSDCPDHLFPARLSMPRVNNSIVKRLELPVSGMSGTCLEYHFKYLFRRKWENVVVA